MQQFVFIILASFAGAIFAQSSGNPPPPELIALVPPNMRDKAAQGYNSLTPDQQAQARQLARSLSDQQKQQVQTVLSDPAVQQGNFQQASPSTQATAKQLCQSLSPQQQQGVFGLANQLGIQVSPQMCSAMSGAGAGPSANPSGGGMPGPGGDMNQMCCMWAQMGECDRNPFWMKPNCPTSCGTPGATVQNAFSQPSKPSANCGSGGMGNMMGPNMGGGMGPNSMGQGGMGQGGMGQGGMGQGGMGQGGMGGQNRNSPQCYDVTEMCVFWGAMGECQKNRSWMTANCQRACGSCGGGGGGGQFGGGGQGGQFGGGGQGGQGGQMGGGL